MYNSLKFGWLPLADLCTKYNKDKGNMNKILDKIENKEKIGNTWIVKEYEFVENIKTDKKFEMSDIEKLEDSIESFTCKLSEKIRPNQISNRFSDKNCMEGDKIIQTFLEWAVKCQISFPVVIYKGLEENELYTKFLLVQSLWNKSIKKEERKSNSY